MKIWTLMALFMVGCFSRSGQSSKPDGGELSTFDQFTRWGLGIGGFSAPPSTGAAQDTASWGGDDGNWGDDDDWDTGGWGGDADDGSIGACWYSGICYEVPRSSCPEEADWDSGSCPEDVKRTATTTKLETKITASVRVVGGVK